MNKKYFDHFYNILWLTFKSFHFSLHQTKHEKLGNEEIKKKIKKGKQREDSELIRSSQTLPVLLLQIHPGANCFDTRRESRQLRPLLSALSLFPPEASRNSQQLQNHETSSDGWWLAFIHFLSRARRQLRE